MKFIAASLFALGTFAARPAAAAKASAVSPAKATYAAKCAGCHGKDAKGNPSMAKMFKLDVAALNLAGKADDTKFPDIIANGKGKMPAFKTKLKAAEIEELVAYIRSLAVPKAAN